MPPRVKHSAALLLLIPSLLLTLPAQAAPPDLQALVQLPLEERRTQLKAISREDLAALFKATSVPAILAAGKASAAQLGPYYEARVVKRERISGELNKAQIIKLLIQQSPLALRTEIIGGPHKGQQVIYNPAEKAGEMRVREGGILGILGGLWIDMNGKLARGATNHPITDLAFTSVLKILEDTFAQAEAVGGYARQDEGFDTAGRYCMIFTAPPTGQHLYATRARVCIDPLLALPGVLEIDDAQGPLERFEFSDVKSVSGGNFSTSSL